jgi:hypothetical protein
VKSNTSRTIEQVVKEGSTDSKTVRGSNLREFVAFLREKDPACTFSGLRRISDESSGKAMWVTEASAKFITDDNEAANNKNIEAANDDVEEVSRPIDESEPEGVKTLKKALEDANSTIKKQQADTDQCCCVVL